MAFGKGIAHWIFFIVNELKAFMESKSSRIKEIAKCKRVLMVLN